jgi:hypothetical protein
MVDNFQAEKTGIVLGWTPPVTKSLMAISDIWVLVGTSRALR